MRSQVQRKWALRLLAFVLVMTGARSVSAETVTLLWDRSPDANVAGYLVYVGTQPGVRAVTYDVGDATSFVYSAAVPGQQYYFSVAAYTPGPVVGEPSAEVSGSSNAAPVLANPGNQTSMVGEAVSLQLVGSDPLGQSVSYGATLLPPGLTLSASTGVISGTPSAPGVYAVTTTVTDGSLSDAETFTWTVNRASDTTPPALRITIPTLLFSYSTTQTFVTVGGTARDNDQVSEVSWTTDRGFEGRASGTESWIAGVPLRRGKNTITVRASDAAGNVSTRSIIVKSNPR
jgi:hypothetical protein